MANRDRTRSVISSRRSNASSVEQPGGIVQSEDQFTTYANACEILVSGEDACINFGLKVPREQGASKGVATVYLSLVQFKRLVLIGSAIIQGTEDALGREVEFDPNARLQQAGIKQKIEARIALLSQQGAGVLGTDVVENGG